MVCSSFCLEYIFSQRRYRYPLGIHFLPYKFCKNLDHFLLPSFNILPHQDFKIALKREVFMICWVVTVSQSTSYSFEVSRRGFLRKYLPFTWRTLRCTFFCHNVLQFSWCMLLVFCSSNFCFYFCTFGLKHDRRFVFDIVDSQMVTNNLWLLQ